MKRYVTQYDGEFYRLEDVQALAKECLPIIETLIELDDHDICPHCAVNRSVRDKLKAIIEAKP